MYGKSVWWHLGWDISRHGTWTTDKCRICDNKLQFVVVLNQTSNETRTRIQLSEGLSRGLGAMLSGEIEITHCDHNLHSPEPDQLSGLCLPAPTISTVGDIKVLTLIRLYLVHLNLILIINFNLKNKSNTFFHLLFLISLSECRFLCILPVVGFSWTVCC